MNKKGFKDQQHTNKERKKRFNDYFKLLDRLKETTAQDHRMKHCNIYFIRSDLDCWYFYNEMTKRASEEERESVWEKDAMWILISY